MHIINQWTVLDMCLLPCSLHQSLRVSMWKSWWNWYQNMPESNAPFLDYDSRWGEWKCSKPNTRVCWFFMYGRTLKCLYFVTTFYLLYAICLASISSMSSCYCMTLLSSLLLCKSKFIIMLPVETNPNLNLNMGILKCLFLYLITSVTFIEPWRKC